MADIRARGLDKMDLSVRGFRHIPPEVYKTEEARMKLSYAEVFDISKNMLESLPENDFFYYLSAVKKLKISQNRITVLPDEFGKCNFMELFEADSNRLHTITPEIGHLNLLQRIGT
jgi:Leucine-rich repeat (LRR) protein